MSLQYDEYLTEHIRNVESGLLWMCDNLDLNACGVKDTDISEALSGTSVHDSAKYTDDEYDAYDDYFYGGNRSYAVKRAFDYAWLDHIHRDPHHWQYWILFEDDPKKEDQNNSPYDGPKKEDRNNPPYKALEMPVHYVLEMIADWWSFSWKDKNLTEIFNWYTDHENTVILHPKTKKLVDNILRELWYALQDSNPIEHSGVKGMKWHVHNGPPYPLDLNKVAKKIHDDAVKNNTYISADVERAAKKAGGTLHGLEYKTKTEESIKRKINKRMAEKGLDLSNAANTIKDASRYTVIADTNDFVKVYNNFKDIMAKDGYKETSCDNYFDKFSKGEVKHKAVQSNFETEDGYEFEVQFQTPESQQAKDKKLPLYNERRSTDISEERAKELEKQMEDLALEVPDPIGIETIKTYDNHLKHSDIEDNDKKYGIPEQKKFPMPDADHVRSAIRFFNYVEPKYEKQLANAILARMEEYGMSFDDFNVGDENRFKNYIPKGEKNDGHK